MPRLSRARAALCAPALGLALLAPALPALTPASSALAAQGTLSVSPKVYVGGQLLTFEGHLGLRNQRIKLQSRAVNRPGATWVVVPGSGSETDRNGDFSFRHPAPSMFNKSYRVVGGGRATEGVLLNARSQDVVLWAEGDPVAGEPFTVVADTVPGPHRPKDSPAFLPKRPDLPPPVFPGRGLTLQERDGEGWRTLDTTTTDSSGQGSFTVTEEQPGTVVYRVRQEDYPQTGGPAIGWFPSFPTGVRVFASDAAARQAADASRASARTVGTGTTTSPVLARGGAEPNATAAGRWGWSPSEFDFAWLAGESLSSRPYRGTDRRGWWLDTSNGSGRVAKHNGGLALESSRNHSGPGDVGTTAATLQDHPMRYGRWEVRVRVKTMEGNARDYRSRVELVPSSGDYCPNRSITVADIAAHSATMQFGAKSVKKGRLWKGSQRIGNIDNVPLTFAVQVTRKHVSWFREGKLIGSAPRAAVPGVPLTLRLSLVGAGEDEMNSTEAKYDWVRGFSLKRGKKPGNGPRMRSARLSGGC